MANPLSRQTMATINRVMQARFQSRWLPKAKTDEEIRQVIEVWYQDLQFLGVTDDSARIGMARAGELRYPPVPSEFADLCRPKPEDLGIPNALDAYLHMVDVVAQWGFTRPDAFLHPVVHAASVRIGYHVIRNSTDQQLRKLFTGTYADLVARAVRGESLDPPIAPRLERPKEPEIPIRSPEERREKARWWANEVKSILREVTP